MQPVASNNWNILINILVQKYFTNLITTCVLWPQNFDFSLVDSADKNIVWLNINPFKLNQAFENNIYNFSKREEIDSKNNVFYNQLIKKLIAAIEHSHCEGFIAFQDDIPKFAKAFHKASVYSIWRSVNNRFLFAYSRDQQRLEYFTHSLFKDQPNILVVEAEFKNSSVFYLKSNKFVGRCSEHPDQLLHLSTFHALNRSFEPDIDLFSPRKLRNLQGREVIIAAFDYRPFVAVDFKRFPLYYDQAADNPSHLVHVDGTEIRTCHIFCEIYNCTLQFDTSEKKEWGLVYSNYSGYGVMGLITEGKIHMGLGAMYLVHPDYVAVDLTVYLGRSGVICLVPAATALTSWDMPLLPFEFTLWSAVLICLVLEGFALFITRKFEQLIMHQPTSWWSCFKFGFKITLKLLINQSSRYLVESHTVRIILFVCYMFDIICTNIYGSGLASVLTLPKYGEAADSVERLAKHNLSWTGSSYAWLASINEKDTDTESIYSRLVNNFVLNTMDEMRLKAQTDNMGFIVERLAFGHFAGGDIFTPVALQRLKLMVEDIYSQYTVGMVARLWPLLEKYNDLLLQWHSSGLDKFWEWKITAEYLNVNEQNQVEASKHNILNRGPTKLTVKNFAGVIVLWVAGVILSAIAFAFEICRFKCIR